MSILVQPTLFPLWVLLLSTPLALTAVVDAARRSNWQRLEQVDYAIWGAATLFVLLGQLMAVTLPDGSQLHYLGIAFLVLLLGYCRSVLSMLLVLGLTVPTQSLGIELLANAVLPAWLMHTLVAQSRRWLPPNPFVFLLGCGFFGLFIVSVLQLLIDPGLFNLFGWMPSTAGSGQLAYSVLLVAGEATLEGMILTILVVYVPRAVYLFDDHFYLSPP